MRVLIAVCRESGGPIAQSRSSPRSARFWMFVTSPRMTVKRKAAVRPTLVSIAVPCAEPSAARGLPTVGCRCANQAGSGTPLRSPPGSSGVDSIGAGGSGSGASGSSSAGSFGTGSFGSMIGSGSGMGAIMS